MTHIPNLSSIGFGGYRISVKSPIHRQALVHALENGCNLIDTSANYTDGDSEKLIGEVLTSYPHFTAYVITKAGYIQGKNLGVLKKLNEQGKATEDLVDISEDLKHSIHPDFLESQINHSLDRLQTNQIDCLLLHNPEYYFELGEQTTTQEYYRRIQKAFEYLEKQVEAGKIGCYGVSSNSFPLATTEKNCTNLQKLIEIATNISSHHSFKFIQFPFNFLETGVFEKHYNGQSLIDVARMNNIKTLANRPLNAFSKQGLLRIATYEREDQELNDEEAKDIFNICMKKIKEKWEADPSITEKIETVPLINQIKEIWNNLPSPDAVDQVFLGHFFPFIANVWGGEGVPPQESKPFYLLYETATLYSQRTLTMRARSFQDSLIKQGAIQVEDQRPLATIACDYYLGTGIDHVLVGMRRKSYVDDFKSLF